MITGEMIGSMMLEAGHNEGRNPDACKDGGKCHHDCRGGCFREKYCVPFSDGGLDDNWLPITQRPNDKGQLHPPKGGPSEQHERQERPR